MCLAVRASTCSKATAALIADPAQESTSICTSPEAKIFFYLEISPLKEREYTGIAQVAASIASEMLGDKSLDPLFFFGRAMVDNEVVADLLRERCGDYLEWHIMRTLSRPAPLSCNGDHVGLFTNRKTCRRAFDCEVQIIHDLSTLLTPQYHHQDTIDFHANSMLDDIQSNDLTVCVSEATRTDVLRYLGPLDPARVLTIHNAASVSAQTLSPSRRNKPYILIIGTIEPRKNVGQILSLLKHSPSFADQFDFIFPGRYGWGAPIEHLVHDYGLTQMVERGTLVFPGFVSEDKKNTLVQSATLVIYPSLFEGFGLPVLEALSQGVPCLTTKSSSMPEVGGDACFYFDPFEEGHFRTAFMYALLEIARNGENLRDRCKAQGEKFSWQRSYRQLIQAVEARVAS